MKTVVETPTDIAHEVKIKWDEFLDLYSLYLRTPMGELREQLDEKAKELRQLGQEDILGFKLP